MREEDLQAPDTLQTPHICEGGNLDCGSGLLLLIRKSMETVPDGKVLEIRSTEISVKEDLPAWCRMTANPYLGWRPAPEHNKYFVQRGETEQEADIAYEQARDYRWQTRIHWGRRDTDKGLLPKPFLVSRSACEFRCARCRAERSRVCPRGTWILLGDGLSGSGITTTGRD